MLVVAAALFLRTFSKLATLNLGFEPGRVLVVTMNAQRAPIEASQRMAVYERGLEAVQALPGVEQRGALASGADQRPQLGQPLRGLGRRAARGLTSAARSAIR